MPCRSTRPLYTSQGKGALSCRWPVADPAGVERVGERSRRRYPGCRLEASRRQQLQGPSGRSRRRRRYSRSSHRLPSSAGYAGAAPARCSHWARTPGRPGIVAGRRGRRRFARRPTGRPSPAPARAARPPPRTDAPRDNAIRNTGLRIIPRRCLTAVNVSSKRPGRSARSGSWSRRIRNRRGSGRRRRPSPPAPPRGSGR